MIDPALPAFKEWQVVVTALARGRQSLILRKGGIAEPRGGFTVANRKFWLFPTHFHEQREKVLPEASSWFDPPSDTVRLTAFAEVLHHAFLDDWSRVGVLAPYHVWTESTVRERFDWSDPPGLHALVVRVHRLREPIAFTPGPDTAGCKSWITLPYRFEDYATDPLPVADIPLLR